jgi:hypothetical protein
MIIAYSFSAILAMLIVGFWMGGEDDNDRTRYY